MTRLSNKAFALILSIAMVMTGMIWLGPVSAYADDEKTGVLTVKVVDQDNAPVSGLELYLEFEGEGATENDNVAFDAATGEDGVASVDITEEEMWPALGDESTESDFYLLKANDESLTYDDVKVEIGMENYKYYVGTVGGNPYTGLYTFAVNKGGDEPLDPNWTEADFTFDGATVTGFSESGTAKLAVNPEVVLPEKNGETAVTTIGTGFMRNTSIASIAMPDSITTISAGAFTQCTGLKKVEFSKSLTAIPQAAFNTCDLKEVILPEGITELGNNAFTGNFNLIKLELPSTLVSIGNSAFGNSQLKELEIPASVKSIGNYAFRVNNENLSNTLEKLTLKEGLESIGNAAFGRSNLTEVTLPSTVTSIHKKAFTNSTNTVKVYTNNAALMASDNPDEQMDLILSPRTVTFDANGGTTEATTAQTGDKGKLASLPEAAKEGYKFLGWFTAAEGGDEVTLDTVFAADATVYVHWEFDKEAAAEAAKAEAEEAKKDADDAKTAAEEAKAASDAAAKTPGQAAVDAAENYVKAADAFAEAAEAAVQAANKAVEAAEAAYEEGSEKISDAKKAADDAAALLAEAEQTKANAAEAKAAAEKGKADADAAKAAADAAAKAAAQQAALQAQYAPGKVVLKKAAKGKKKATVTWKTIKKDVNGYEVQFIDKKTRSVVKTKTFKQTKKLAKKKTIKKTIKGLKKGTYSVQVRAFRTVDGANYYGEWSKVKTAKVN